MTFTFTYVWWWVPAAVTVGCFALWAWPTQRPLELLPESVAALAATAVIWAIAGALK